MRFFKIVNRFSIILILFFGLTFQGCATGTASRSELLSAEQSQVQLRSIQTRAFDIKDKLKTLRVVIATMQDLDFVLDKADEMVGTVTGTKFYKGYSLRLTVTVRPRGENQMLVRANAEYGTKAVSAPEAYQDFFSALEKALFLTAQQVD